MDTNYNIYQGTYTGGQTQPPAQHQGPCPACGYCPHCGRGRQLSPYWPPYQIWYSSQSQMQSNVVLTALRFMVNLTTLGTLSPPVKRQSEGFDSLVSPQY
jgi:hypothetical protein